METDAAPASEVSYDVAFDDFASLINNRTLRGKGQLVIRSPGPTFTFSGPKRQTFEIRRRIVELSFRPEQITNVMVEGRRVVFRVRTGEAGAESALFVFHCRTVGEAAEVGALLPATKDEEFVARHEFTEKLKPLGARAPWQSPTNLIVAANVIVFVVMGLLGAGWIDVADILPYALYGSNRADVTGDGEWWRLLTSLFLHYGVLHLLFNMWALLQTGHLAEKLFGRLHYVLVYFGSGIAGGFGTLAWHRAPLSWSAGASGAIFGLYGALLGYMAREKNALPKSVFRPLLTSTLVFAGYNLLYGMAKSGVDNAAHVGGLVGGILLGWTLALPIEGEARRRVARRRTWLGCAVVAVLVAVGVAVTPHYDYHLMEEVAWSKAMRAEITKENEVTQHHDAAMTALRVNKNPGPFLLWLVDEAIPYYSRLRGEIVAMKFAPGWRTDKRRTAFADVLRMKVESYERLIEGLRTNDRTAMSRFQAEEEKIAGVLKELASRSN